MTSALAELGRIDPLLVWGLFPRLLGVVFLISFVSLLPQIVPMAGRDGIVPVSLRLGRVKKHFGWRRVFYFPTLLWIDSRDFTLRLFTLLGIAASLLAIHGGPWAVVALPCCYVLYLSLDPAVGLVFPWDAMLFEAGFFSFLLPATLGLPDIHAVEAPEPAVAWVYRLLVFRVIFGFGKLKFMGSQKDDLDYLKGFLVNQPLPSPLGWYAHGLPVTVLKGAMIVMFVTEMIVPFFVFFPGPLSVLAAVLIAGLMVGIQLTGNFGYFNIGMAVLCVTLLDSQTPTELDVATLFSPGAPVLTNAIVLLHTIGALLVLPFNSFIANSWMYWPSLYRAPRWLLLPVDLIRVLHPLRWLHSYGVFPPKTPAGVKCVLAMEVSWDGKEWVECRHPIAPTAPESPPRFVAPYHHRADQAMIYETFGLNDTHVFTGVTAAGFPYIMAYASPLQAFVQRMLEGRGKADFFFKKGTFPVDRGAPKMARVRTYMLERTGHSERKKTGKWWRRTYLGPHLPPTGLQEGFWDDVCPPPEVWHFDTWIWKRRSSLRPLIRSARNGENALAAVIADTDEITHDDVDRFWNEFVPAVGAGRDADWSKLPDVVEQARARYTRADMRIFERILGRFSVMLCTRLEPLVLGRMRKPVLPISSYFRLGMLTHQIIGEGREAFENAYADPASTVSDAKALSMPSGGYFMALFRFESFVFQARKQRLLDAVLNMTREGKPNEIPPIIVKLQGWARSLFGCIEMSEFLQTQFTESRYQEPDAPEERPVFTMLRDSTTRVTFERDPTPEAEA